MGRVPKNYRGTKPTGRDIRYILPTVLRSLGDTYQRRGDLLLLAWPEVIGEKFAKMTHAVSFGNGTLRVRVANSTLLSLLTEHEKSRLVRELRERFPQAKVATIHFFIG